MHPFIANQKQAAKSLHGQTQMQEDLDTLDEKEETTKGNLTSLEKKEAKLRETKNDILNSPRGFKVFTCPAV